MIMKWKLINNTISYVSIDIGTDGEYNVQSKIFAQLGKRNDAREWAIDVFPLELEKYKYMKFSSYEDAKLFIEDLYRMS